MSEQQPPKTVDATVDRPGKRRREIIRITDPDDMRWRVEEATKGHPLPLIAWQWAKSAHRKAIELDDPKWAAVANQALALAMRYSYREPSRYDKEKIEEVQAKKTKADDVSGVITYRLPDNGRVVKTDEPKT
jgi:hypothetical protein